MAQVKKKFTAGPWQVNQAGRNVRFLDIEGVQYQQFDHAKGLVISNPYDDNSCTNDFLEELTVVPRARPRWTPPSNAQTVQSRFTSDPVFEYPRNSRRDDSFVGSRHESPNFYATSQTVPYSLFPRENETTQSYESTLSGPLRSPGLETGGSFVPRQKGIGDEPAEDRGPNFATAKGATSLQSYSLTDTTSQARYRTDSRPNEHTQQIVRNYEVRSTTSDDHIRSDARKDVRHAADLVHRTRISDDLSVELSGLEIEDRKRRQHEKSYESAISRSRPAMPIVSDRTLARPISAAVGVENVATAPSITSSHKISDGDRESLDPRYNRRSNARQFFVVGRVFAMLWHENAVESKRSGFTELSSPVLVAAKHGERVFSHIRRFVVVRERHGYCLCIPINTYGGRGVMKAGLSLDTRKAHAVIHSDETEPFISPEERRMITKNPISVKMASSDQKLDEMSRVDFSKIYTVEWNVKVMNVGRVTPESMAAFQGYWYNECAT